MTTTIATTCSFLYFLDGVLHRGSKSHDFLFRYEGRIRMRISEEDVLPCIGEDGQTVMTTLTNSGYMLYTLNLLKSLQPYGLDKKVLVVCMDEKAVSVLRRRGFHAFLAKEEGKEEGKEEEDLSRFCPWNTKGYDAICYTKLCIIHHLLSMNKHVLLVDGDVVFRKDPRAEWRRWWSSSPSYEVYVQNDAERDEDTTNLCTGYMWIRSSPRTRVVYDCETPEGKEHYRSCAFDNNDQTYFNRFVKPVCRVNALPLSLYPNGAVYQKRKRELDASGSCVLVHFNWLKGHFKLVVMKQNGMWLLTPEEERGTV